MTIVDASANASPRSSPFFEVDAKMLEIWDKAQRLQSDLNFPMEAPAFFMSEAWRRAEHVLDVGAGNGYYLGHLSAMFPEKAYCGIDNCEELIKIANQENDSGNIRFEPIPFLESSGQYDALIMRLFLQHMTDVDANLTHAALLTSPGGALFIFDAFDAARLFEPDLPEVMAFFRAFAETSARRGLDRDVRNRVHQALQTSSHWRLEREMRTIVSSAIPGTIELFRNIYTLFIDLAEHTRALDYDFAAVREEWRRWCALEKAYSQIGLTIIELSRQA